MHNIILGMRYFFSGFELIGKPGLRRFVLIPLFVNIIFFLSLFFLAYHYIGELNTWFESFIPTWLRWLGFLIWVLFFSSFFLIFVYTFVTIANLIAAPFNSLLAEKVEAYLTGALLPSRGMIENIKDVPRIIGRQFSIIFYYVPRAIFLLILFFIPVVQAIAAIFWFMFNAWFMSLTYLDYPTDNHRLSFQAMRTWLNQRRGIAFGFGFSVLICSMIPILNFVAIPVAVAGATKFWVDESKKRTL